MLFGQKRKKFGTPPFVPGSTPPFVADQPVFGAGVNQAPQNNQSSQKSQNWRKILGVVGDSLSILGGGQPTYGPMMQQRAQFEAQQRARQAQMEAEEARRLDDRNYEAQEWQRRQEWQNANPDPAPMVRDVAAWQAMTPEQQAAYTAMNEAKAPPFTGVIGNQFYSIPRSGLVGSSQGQPAPNAPRAPVGKLRPYNPGGPTQPASGNFPRRPIG